MPGLNKLLGIIGTVLRANDMFRAFKRMEERKDTSKEMKNKKMEYKKIQDFKNTFFIPL
jgi:hypothetical protein